MRVEAAGIWNVKLVPLLAVDFDNCVDIAGGS